MRKINLILANAAIAAALLMSSCKADDEDETKADEVAGPSVILQNDGNSSILADKSVDKSSELSFQLKISKGDKNVEFLKIEKALSPSTTFDVIATATVTEDGKSSAQKYNATEASYELPNSGGLFNFKLTASDQEGTVTTYKFTVKDKDGLTSFKSVKITTNTSSPSLSTKAGNKIYNADAPAGFNGAFDFDALVSVSSSDASGDIQDAGIPQPKRALVALQAKETWYQQFSAEGGATLKSISKTDYENASTLADIESLYASGTLVGGSEDYTVNDAYVIKTKDGKYVAFIITAVTPSSANNEDYVTFSTKSAVATKKTVRDLKAADLQVAN